MEVIPIRTPLIREGDDVVAALISSFELRDGDVVAISDKVIAASEGRFIDYENLSPSEEALKLAMESGLEPGFAELVIRSSDAIIGTSLRTILSVKDGILVANAGIDHKNAPEGKAALWPEDPNLEARRIRDEIERRTGKRVGVIIVDSRLSPLRMGTTGFALGIAGFRAIRDFRGRRDLYGKRILVTTLNVADDLASAAHLLMGEGDDLIPFVVIRGAPVELGDFDPEEVKISPELCAYFRPLYGSLSGKWKKSK
ncbi:MAG: coenzyme F420-0:L-glutamate ligase [Candidatus Korarchaeum sp.]